jgi:hypothetical protein
MCPKDKEPEQRRTSPPKKRYKPKNPKRMESHELGYQVAKPLAMKEDVIQ